MRLLPGVTKDMSCREAPLGLIFIHNIFFYFIMGRATVRFLSLSIYMSVCVKVGRYFPL